MKYDYLMSVTYLHLLFQVNNPAMANGKAYITADKEYTNPVIVFAAYEGEKLVCVRFINKDLDAGVNEIDIPADFSADNANTVKVMVWNSLADMEPLFKAYEE